MTTFHEEVASMVIKEGYELFRGHYYEIAWKTDKIPLAPNYDAYLQLEKLNRLRCYTVRNQGELVGYSVWFIMPEHPHYRLTSYAQNDILYVRPDQRGTTGIKLLKFSEQMLREAGVDVLSLHVKKTMDWGALAERLGFDPVDTIYNKWVGV